MHYDKHSSYNTGFIHRKMFVLNIFSFDIYKQQEGAFALVLKSTKCYPGECVATKRGSPLLIGIKVLIYDI